MSFSHLRRGSYLRSRLSCLPFWLTAGGPWATSRLVAVQRNASCIPPSSTIAAVVDDNSAFWGPKGGDRGTGAKGLKDDCMAPGCAIKVAIAKDGKTAKDVYLPTRKAKK
jgi:hypothetical protein